MRAGGIAFSRHVVTFWKPRALLRKEAQEIEGADGHGTVGFVKHQLNCR